MVKWCIDHSSLVIFGAHAHFGSVQPNTHSGMDMTSGYDLGQ